MAKSKTPAEQGTFEKISEYITEKDKFGQQVRWNINKERNIKNAPSGILSICFMLVFWLMTIFALMEQGMKSNFTITK